MFEAEFVDIINDSSSNNYYNDSGQRSNDTSRINSTADGGSDLGLQFTMLATSWTGFFSPTIYIYL